MPRSSAILFANGLPNTRAVAEAVGVGVAAGGEGGEEGADCGGEAVSAGAGLEVDC